MYMYLFLKTFWHNEHNFIKPDSSIRGVHLPYNLKWAAAPCTKRSPVSIYNAPSYNERLPSLPTARNCNEQNLGVTIQLPSNQGIDA